MDVSELPSAEKAALRVTGIAIQKQRLRSGHRDETRPGAGFWKRFEPRGDLLVELSRRVLIELLVGDDRARGRLVDAATWKLQSHHSSTNFVPRSE